MEAGCNPKVSERFTLASEVGGDEVGLEGRLKSQV